MRRLGFFGEQIERGGGDFRCVAETFEPVHILLAAKPGELALGEPARRLLDLRHRIRERDAAFEVRAQVGVADELERFTSHGLGRNGRAARHAFSAGTPPGLTSARTSSSQPAASIASTRASMRAYRAARGGCKPIFVIA